MGCAWYGIRCGAYGKSVALIGPTMLAVYFMPRHAFAGEHIRSCVSTALSVEALRTVTGYYFTSGPAQGSTRPSPFTV